MNWCAIEYGHEATVIPVMVHPQHRIERTGSPPPGTRVLTRGKLSALKYVVREYTRALAQNDQYRDAAAVDQQLQQDNLSAATIIIHFTEAGRREPK